MAGKFIGVGVGPGDPELITLKAARYMQTADVVSYIASEGGRSQARTIASNVLKAAVETQREIPVVMPMCEDRTIANDVYDAAALDIKNALDAGKTVVFLCEGDPLFFGSFGYLLERLQETHACEVVPGISSVNAAASALQLPLTILKESFVVVSGRHTEEKLCNALSQHESVVIMKAGRSRQRILAALRKTNRLGDAKYLEYIGRDNESVCMNVNELPDEPGPYFSLFVVLRSERDRT